MEESVSRRAARGSWRGKKRRMLVLVSTAALFALSVVLATTSLARPGGGDSAGKLTREQREQFAAGAREVAGLSEAQISAALKDPAARAAIPVYAEAVPFAPETSGSSAQSRGALATKCKTAGGQVNYYNNSGQVLAYFRVLKNWCFDYSRITSVPAPTVSAGATDLGARVGWRYKGLLRGNDYYVPYKGLSRGGHVSSRTGNFKVCTAATDCIQKTPRVRVTVYYDGNSYTTTKV